MTSPSAADRLRSLSAAGLALGPRVVAVVIAVGAVLALLAPLPEMLVDLLLAASLGAAAATLLMALATADPARLTSMPPLLVLTSLARIVLCLCITRLVLLTGGGGTLVHTLGDVAGGRDPIAGLGLLVVLAIVQLVMVTAGVGRMAEVAARFALDALPGKQMGLDTAVGAGHMSAREAQAEVRRLEQEANFYGAMDGAGRLLRGEAVAALAIVVLTALAGAARAVGAGTGLPEAARAYALLAAGQGLVTILPALVMAAASAVMVSRSAHGSPLVEELGDQMFVSPWPAAAAALALIGLGLLPGVAKIPTLVGGAALALGAWWLSRRGDLPDHRGLAHEGADPPGSPAGDLAIELGMGLLGLVEGPTSLMNLLPALRTNCSRELGFEIPAIVVRDSLELGATEYAFAFRAGTLARGTVRSSGTLAVPPLAGAMPDIGRPAELPDGRAGVWVEVDEAQELAAMGYALMTPQQALAEYLCIALWRHAAELFDLERAADMLAALWRDHPGLKVEADAAGMAVPLFRHVCGELLLAGIPLRDPLSVAEGVIEVLPELSDPEQIALHVRPRLAAMLSDHLATDGRIRAILLAPELEDELAECAHREGGRTVAAMPPARAAAWVDLLDQVGTEHGWGAPVAVVVEARALLPLRSLCRQARPCLVVVRATDLSPQAQVEHVARLEPGRLA